MRKKFLLIFFIVIFVFFMIFTIGRKVYGNMAMHDNKSAGENVALGDDKMDETVTGANTGIDTAIEGSESAEEKVEYVDEKMNEALAGDQYNKMSLEERKELASGILSRLEQDGYITGLSYNEDSFMYSFEYVDGTLGGWCIKDFSAQDGSLPMN